jgi:hypothetical protein
MLGIERFGTCNNKIERDVLIAYPAEHACEYN